MTEKLVTEDNQNKSSQIIDWTPFISVAAAIIFVVFLIYWAWPRVAYMLR